MRCTLLNSNKLKGESIKAHHFLYFGGELEIRTLAGLASPIGFQDRPLQPLG